MSLLSVALERLGSPILGVILPALIFLVAFSLTYWLYRRFSLGAGKPQNRAERSAPQGAKSSKPRVRT